MPTRRPIHFGSTAWPQKTGGRTWWNQRTNLWRFMIQKVEQWCRKTERSNSQPHGLRSSWLVYGRNWVVFHEKPLLSTSEDRQAQGPQGVRWRNFERKSAHVTWRLWREDAQSAFHSPQRLFTGDFAPKKVFHEKADKCEKALFQFLPKGELGKLARSLKYYKTLRTLEVIGFECSEDEATLFGKAQHLKNRDVQSRLLSFFNMLFSLFRRFWGIFPCLQSFDPEQPFHSPCKALAEYLAEAKSLKTLRIREGQNGDLIVKASWWVGEDQ